MARNWGQIKNDRESLLHLDFGLKGIDWQTAEQAERE